MKQASPLPGRATRSVGRLVEEMLEAAAASPWGHAYIRSRAQQILAQHLRIETNLALRSLGRKTRYVPAVRDADPWRRIESRMNHHAEDLALNLVDAWRVEQASYEAGGRDTPPQWPTIEEDAP